ncbi:MAG: PRC-barrel domain-containing protein [Cellulomonas sp.]
MSNAEAVGSVDGFVLDPVTSMVVALHLRKTKNGDTLLWRDVTAFGVDAVTVSGDDKITDPGGEVVALSGKDHQVVGKRVLSTAGDELGEVTDVEFDPDSGAVTALVLNTGGVAGTRLVGVGSYAVVVSAD